VQGKSVLLAWELGAGLGHAKRLLRIAIALKERGYKPVVAARELWAAAGEYQKAGIALLQAPHHQSLAPPNFRARGYADMLAACGFQRQEALAPVVAGWDTLLGYVRASVVVADYSPILSLAAWGRVPLLAIGDGFVLPPAQLSRFPRLRAQGSPMAEEAQLLQVAQSVQNPRGSPSPHTLPALIGGQAQVVCTFPETDIYAAQRQEKALGPLEGAQEPLSNPKPKRAFAYLAADFPATAKLLQALADTKVPAEAFVRGLPPQMRRALELGGILVHETPPPLAQILLRFGMVIHHGGIGTLETCAALGIPQLIMPRHLEQSLNAQNAVKLGVAKYLANTFSLADAQSAILEVLASAPLADKAHEIAHLIGSRGAPTSMSAILQACDRLAQ
jgi:rhamnosyltransferase subunit B